MKPWQLGFGLFVFVGSFLAWEEHGWAGLIGLYCCFGVLALIGFIETNHEKKNRKLAGTKETVAVTVISTEVAALMAVAETEQ